MWVLRGRSVSSERTYWGCTALEQGQSEQCEDCFWWHEDQVLCG
jgi:hypothetical protein